MWDLKKKFKKGLISNSAAITLGLGVMAWLAIQVYTDINNRLTDVESDHNAVVAIQADIQWIKSALQDKGFSARSSFASSTNEFSIK